MGKQQLKKNLFKEPNAYKNLYLSVCFGVMYLAWGSFNSLILLLFNKVGRAEMAYYILIVYYSSEGLFNLFLSHYLYTKVPSEKRKYIFSLSALGFIIYLWAAFNIANCQEQEEYENDEDKYASLTVCTNTFIWFSMMSVAVLGGVCNGLMTLMSGLYTVACARPWSRARFLSLFNAIMVFSWGIGLLATDYILGNWLNGSVSNFILTLMGTIGIAAIMFLFLQKPVPAKLDQRSIDQKDSDHMEGAANIVDEIMEQNDPKLEKLVQPVARTFSDERAIIKYLKVSEKQIQSSGKDVSISLYKIRIKEMFTFLRRDIFIKLVIPSYIMDGLSAAFWTNCSMWIVKTVQKELNSNNVYQQLNIVIYIELTAKTMEFIFLFVWGYLFDNSFKLGKKGIFIAVHLFIALFMVMTMIGFNLKEYEIFFSVAIFYSIAMQGLKVTAGPVRNEQYAPDQRKILYGVATQRFIINVIQAFGYFIGSIIITSNPLWYLLIFAPIFCLSFFNMMKRINFK